MPILGLGTGGLRDSEVSFVFTLYTQVEVNSSVYFLLLLRIKRLDFILLSQFCLFFVFIKNKKTLDFILLSARMHQKIVEKSLRLGYRMIDTAAVYQNEGYLFKDVFKHFLQLLSGRLYRTKPNVFIFFFVLFPKPNCKKIAKQYFIINFVQNQLSFIEYQLLSLSSRISSASCAQKAAFYYH